MLNRFIVLLAILIVSQVQATTLVELVGTDFKGGAADLYGSVMGGEVNVNYVYAQSTGGRSTMQATLNLALESRDGWFIHIKGKDDDFPDQCSIVILVNDQVVFSGKNSFSAKKWEVMKFPIPAGVLKEGHNTVTVANLEEEGRTGMPPWFQVARCAIADGEYTFHRDITKDFQITLPDNVCPFPEPLQPGQKPGFAMRGIKGWMWTPEQYLAEIPVLAKYKLNFLQNCYTSMCDTEHYKWGDPNVNRWWEDLPAEKKAAYEKIVRECQKNKIEFCFSMNPNLCSKRALDYNSAKDVDDLWKHYAWMQSLGVKWFNISLDDISSGIDPAGQSKVVNEIYRRLKAKDPEAKMIFCPTIYWGDGTPENERKYLETVAKELDKNVYLFWTGDSVVGNITHKAADSYRRISGHKLFLWDNYPVNDAHPTMHLGPVINRDKDLCEVVDGYMANSLCQQNEANRIPVLTAMDYAYNPYAYDPIRSIQQAIMHLETKPEEREMIREMVEMYPGFVIFGRPATGLNPVRENFSKIMAMPHARWICEGYIRSLEDFADRMDKVFPTRYQPERTTIRNDIAYLRKMIGERYAE